VTEGGGGGTDLNAEVLGFAPDVPPLGVGHLGGLSRFGGGRATVLAPRDEARDERRDAARNRTPARKVGVAANLGAGTGIA